MVDLNLSKYLSDKFSYNCVAIGYAFIAKITKLKRQVVKQKVQLENIVIILNVKVFAV